MLMALCDLDWLRGELFKMVSEPVFEKVRDVDRKRLCNVDSIAQDSDLSCFMGESQTDGAYFSWSGDRDDPCVSFLAGDASLRGSHDVNSWDRTLRIVWTEMIMSGLWKMIVMVLLL